MLDDIQLLEGLEIILQDALVANDLEKLQKITHSNFTYTDEFGTLYKCLADLQSKSPYVMTLSSIEIIDREIKHFENVAVVNSTELRIGTFDGKPFKANYFVSRVWKKNSKWSLLGVTLVRL